MTEIREYRGKRVDTGEWVYGYVCRAIDFWQSECPLAIQVIEQMPTDIDDTVINYCSHLEEVDPETVGRWSGERNFEGNKIYNGDYIETWDTIILIREVRGGGLAPFRQTKNGFTRMTNWDHAIHGKIIGTIHDQRNYSH